MYGPIKHVEMPADRIHNVSRGLAYVEYDTAESAEKAIKHMDGGYYMHFIFYCYS